MASRTSIGEMMTNVWENGQYTLSSSMANNPIAYLTYKLAGLLDAAVGGIDLPFVNVMGFGVDLNTTVSDLMRVASMTGGILGSLGPMISGLSSSFSGRNMLATMGITSESGIEVVQRGDGGIGDTGQEGGGGQSTSGSGYVGNSSGSDVKNSTIQEAEDSKKQQMIEAKEEEPENKVDVLNTYVLKIYELLEDVASGKRGFTVKSANYGLTSSGSSSSISNALGGTAGLQSNSSGGSGIGAGASTGSGVALSGGFGTGGSSSGSSSSDIFGSKNGIDLGGWTML
jgi:hypothetical protein